MSTEEVVNPPVTDADQLSCLACDKVIDDASESSVQCSKCDMWCHVKCSMTKEIFDTLAKIGKSKKKLVKFGMVSFICCSLTKPVDKVSTVAQTVTPSIPETAREVASRASMEDEMAHTSPPTSHASTSTVNGVASRPPVEVEKAHTSPPTSLTSAATQTAQMTNY